MVCRNQPASGELTDLLRRGATRALAFSAHRLQLIEIPARLLVSIVVTASGSVFT